MGTKSKIEWTEATWNPLTGCQKISAGCDNCYAEVMANRLKQNPMTKRYRNGFVLTLHEDLVDMPLRKTKPKMFFVNSMSDLFHGKVPVEFIQKVFKTMNEAHWHTFQILTKRADRLAKLSLDGKLNWTPNIWMGVSVENQVVDHRIGHLLQTGAHVKWLSMEPLIGPVHLDENQLKELDWIVAGGESGPKARPCRPNWVRDIRDQCVDADVPFFFKQWGRWLPLDQHSNKTSIEKICATDNVYFEDLDFTFTPCGMKGAGSLLDGRTWEQMPEIKP